jgi:hypothetical protein
MGSVTVVGAADFTVDHFAETDRATGAARVTAIVVRRVTPQPLRSLSLGESLRLLLTPFRRASRPPPDVPPVRDLPPGWNAGSDVGGPREVLHSATLRRVRVAGREFPFAPPAQTLVLLVDDRRPADATVDADAGATTAPPITSHAVTIPPVACASPAAATTDAERRRRWRAESEQLARVVDEALTALPEMRRLVPMWRPRTR